MIHLLPIHLSTSLCSDITRCFKFILNFLCLSPRIRLLGEGNGTPIPWTEEPGRLQSMGSLESDRTEQLHFHFSLSCIGEGNGNPLQCSCLENPRNGGAWWAAIYGVAQSQTRLKWLSSSSSLELTSFPSALFLFLFFLKSIFINI